jgi:hypothetical protein
MPVGPPLNMPANILDMLSKEFRALYLHIMNFGEVRVRYQIAQSFVYVTRHALRVNVVQDP